MKKSTPTVVMNRLAVSLPLLASLASGAACGLPFQPGETNRLRGDDGQSFTVEDLTLIANDPALDEPGRRDAFRALGILDEVLIDALLEL